MGTFGHQVASYKASPEYSRLAPSTRRMRTKYLDEMVQAGYGPLRVATISRDAVYEYRDQFSETPRTADMIVAAIKRLISFAVDKYQSTFELAFNPLSNPIRPMLVAAATNDTELTT